MSAVSARPQLVLAPSRVRGALMSVRGCWGDAARSQNGFPDRGPHIMHQLLLYYRLRSCLHSLSPLSRRSLLILIESKTGYAPLRTQPLPHHRSAHRLLRNRQQPYLQTRGSDPAIPRCAPWITTAFYAAPAQVKDGAMRMILFLEEVGRVLVASFYRSVPF